MKKIFLSTISALVLAASSATAQDYPSGPIEMMIGFGAGGTTDTQGRALAAALEDAISQPVNVVNRPGAGGSVAAAQVAVSDPDGYTVLFSGGRAISFNPLVSPVDYTLDDFIFIGAVSLSQPAIVARGDSAYETLADAIADAAETTVSYATQTTLDRLIISMIRGDAGVTIDIVRPRAEAAWSPCSWPATSTSPTAAASTRNTPKAAT